VKDTFRTRERGGYTKCHERIRYSFIVPVVVSFLRTMFQEYLWLIIRCFHGTGNARASTACLSALKGKCIWSGEYWRKSIRICLRRKGNLPWKRKHNAGI